MNNIFIVVLLSLFVEKLSAQSDTVLLRQKVETAALVFEGKVMGDSTFWNANKTRIYTLRYVLVCKEFKGVFKSDTVVILRHESYSKVGDEVQEVKDGDPLILNKDIEGIFFCKPIDSRGYYNEVKNDNVYELNIPFNCDGFIQIICDKQLNTIYHKAHNFCDATVYDDVKKQLFQPIEKIVGHVGKRLRLDCLEQSKPNK